MNETEIIAAVNDIINENNLSAVITETEYDDGFYVVEVEVDRKDFRRANELENFFDTYRIRWAQKTPKLVPAEVGNFVLIYSEHESSEAEAAVGLVSAKYTEENGQVYYGCRYIKISLNNMFANSMYDFELTEENYGGYPKGFLKVLTSEELKNHIQNQLQVAFEAELKSVEALYKRSTENLDRVISLFSKTKLVKSEQIELDEGNSYTIHVKV